MEGLEGFQGTVPLFPLPGVILFPRTILPLHIFEPRYREMVADAIAGNRLISVALLKPGWEPEYYNSPAVYPVIGVGRVLQDDKLEDGRYNILVQGICRARIEGSVEGRPYRQVRISVLPEPEVPADPAIERLRLALLAVYSTLLQSVEKKVPFKIESNLGIGTLCDLLVAFLDSDIHEKQGVLEELDLALRAERTIELLRKSSVAGKPVESGLRRARGRDWPPPTGLN